MSSDSHACAFNQQEGNALMRKPPFLGWSCWTPDPGLQELRGISGYLAISAVPDFSNPLHSPNCQLRGGEVYIKPSHTFLSGSWETIYNNLNAEVLLLCKTRHFTEKMSFACILKTWTRWTQHFTLPHCWGAEISLSILLGSSTSVPSEVLDFWGLVLEFETLR